MQKELDVALIQSSLEWEDINFNINAFEKKIHELQNQVDLIVLPEMFTTGFTMNASKFAEEPGGASLSWMQRMAKEKNAALTGSIIVKEKNKYYNRLYFVLPSGEFYAYNKKHTFTLAGENNVYASGKEKLVINFRGWKICPLICYDLRFPVWVRNVEHYDLVLFVANWPKKRVTAWDALLKARAIENMSYCIGVNRTGLDGNGIEYPGHSMSFDALGTEMLSNKTLGEEVFRVNLQKEHLEKTRNSLGFLKDMDEFILK